MSQENFNLNLNGKMSDWGPFGPNEGKWLIFSIGNPEEGHGYALPRMMDDFFAQRVAHLISCKTGFRYVAHIPWTTDGVGIIAKDWGPKFIPPEELANKVVKFIQFHMNNYKEMGLPCDRIFIYSGHGGNNPLADFTEMIKKKLKVKELIITKTDDIMEVAEKILDDAKRLTMKLGKTDEERKQIAREFTTILLGAGHAGHMEHSIAAAIGILDEKKLKIMNEKLEKNFEEALKKWPPIGGLGGYLLQGGKYTDALGTKKDDRYGLWKCLKALKKLDNGRIKPIKELGELVIKVSVEYYSNILLKKLSK
ncbi:MAG: hypothetical protein ACTSUL_03975 [Promethearchaeota archaeon]